MGGLLNLVQRGVWAGCGPAHSAPRCTERNSPSINGQCTNFILFDVALQLPLHCKGLNWCRACYVTCPGHSLATVTDHPVRSNLVMGRADWFRFSRHKAVNLRSFGCNLHCRRRRYTTPCLDARRFTMHMLRTIGRWRIAHYDYGLHLHYNAIALMTASCCARSQRQLTLYRGSGGE